MVNVYSVAWFPSSKNQMHWKTEKKTVLVLRFFLLFNLGMFFLKMNITLFSSTIVDTSIFPLPV